MKYIYMIQYTIIILCALSGLYLEEFILIYLAVFFAIVYPQVNDMINKTNRACK